MMRAADKPMVVRSVQTADILRTNRAFDEIIGVEAGQLGEQSLVDWIHPQDRGRLESAVEHGKGHLEARHRTGGGSWVNLAWEIRTADGVRVALGRSPDETARGEAESRARGPATTASLADTLVGMARIVEAKNPGTRCSILLVTPCGQRVSVGAGPSLPAEYNDAVEGLRIGPAVGSCGTAAYWDVPVVVENIAEDPLWRDLRDAADIAGVGACWSVPIHATGGDVLGAMALYADEPRAPTATQMDGLEIASRMVGLAVERDMLEQQLRDGAKMEALGRLASEVAHNFNNLLTVILGHVELLGEEPNRPPDVATLDTIRRAVTTASEITGQLLAFGGKPPQQPARADLIESLHELTRVLGPLIGDHISVSIETDPSLRWITIDRSHVGQIMLNLLLNARDAMSDGGHVMIRTRRATMRETAAANAALPASRYIAVSVTDSGAGMDATTRDKAFEPFFTTKSGQGTGLGLATVYALTTQSGGHVALESERGMGTTVTLLFPQDPSEIQDGARPQGTDSIGSVLVAEDNDEIRSLIVRVMSSMGFEVAEARNGLDAWALYEAGLRVDLLVADVTMGRMNGVELAKRVRGQTPDAKVLFVSGHALNRIVRTQPDVSPNLYLPKPFSPSQLRDAVRRVLSVR